MINSLVPERMQILATYYVSCPSEGGGAAMEEIVIYEHVQHTHIYIQSNSFVLHVYRKYMNGNATAAGSVAYSSPAASLLPGSSRSHPHISDEGQECMVHLIDLSRRLLSHFQGLHL